MSAQLDATGRLRHLLTLDGLPAPLLLRLLERARGFVSAAGTPAARGRDLEGRAVANLFLEPSTRTRVSFELAARRLGADVVNVESAGASMVKGETLLDTVYTLEAMRTDFFVIRTAESGAPARVAAHVADGVAVVSGGEAHLSHPTQGLLDTLTIVQRKPELDRLVVCIVGDIAHSRVARSATQALRTLGVRELRLVAPPELMPDAVEFPGAARSTDLDDALAGADVVMALRIQKERMAEAEIPDQVAYRTRFGLTRERMKLARPDAIVMHPGPMNRGVEIESDVADGRQSVIRTQVANGVAVRMAVLAMLAEGTRAR
jgi:aspartate carbamoyltransferase catalytic subunit